MADQCIHRILDHISCNLAVKHHATHACIGRNLTGPYIHQLNIYIQIIFQVWLYLIFAQFCIWPDNILTDFNRNKNNIKVVPYKILFGPDKILFHMKLYLPKILSGQI